MLANTPNTKRPFGVEVSTPSCSNTNGTSNASNSAKAFTRCLRLRAKKPDQTGPVFVGRTGERLQSGRHWFEDAVEAAELDDFHWHDLRHTFASRLAMAGVGIRAIQQLLGHKSLAMTVRYSHLSPDFQQEAVDKLVPPEPATEVESGTDTRTDTEASASSEPQTDSVH